VADREPEAPRKRIVLGAAALRRLAPRIFPPILLVVGLVIAIASLDTEVETTYSTSFSGTLGPGNTTLPIGPWSAQYLEVSMSVGACDLHLYFATAAESSLFNTTGQRPARSLGCSNRSMTTTGPTDALILANDGAADLAYGVSARAYSIRTPLGWLAIPGMFAAILGLFLFVPRFVLERALKMRDDLDFNRQKRK